MLLIADTHVHFYPCYDLAAWLDAAFHNLSRPGPHAKILMLTERHDCHAFRDNIFGGDRAGAGALCVNRGPEKLFILAGRQIVTRERLEVLALATDADIADGQPMVDVLKRVRDAGGVPVLAWAPGKWFFKRGKIVVDVLERETPGSLLIGDTSLRPTLWADPDLMSFAHARGFNIIAGSDPLPFPGEEKYVGTYGVACEANFDSTNAAASMQRVLMDAGTKFVTRGKRCGVLEVMRRLQKNYAAK